MHRVLLEQALPSLGQTLVITGDEAVHALRVKRLDIGDDIQIMDGAGVVARAKIESVQKGGKRDGPVIGASIVESAVIPRILPRLEVCSATPKGARLDDMIDGLSQVGAACWSPLETQRGVVDPREAKLARLDRIAREAAKQCGRAWIMGIGSSMPCDAALKSPPGGRVVLADASGSAFVHDPTTADLRLLVGPEGGWTAEELQQARAAGASIARFGVHTMRIEVAAVVAAGYIMGFAGPAASPA